MARLLLLFVTLALLGTISAQTKPLSLKQQQDLVAQLAKLQRQTQQLLDAQKSLAAVAASGVSSTKPAAAVAAETVELDDEVKAELTPKQLLVMKSLVANGAPNNEVLLPKVPKKVVPKVKKTVLKQVVKQAKKRVTATKPKPKAATPKPAALPAKVPQINWGKCPELKPSESSNRAKANEITKCLETTPQPTELTKKSVEKHREQIAECALKAEGWLTQSGGYNYIKAQAEIKFKRMEKTLELQLLSYHDRCKVEAQEKYGSSKGSIIAQVQLYQACMDYWISDVCGIGVN